MSIFQTIYNNTKIRCILAVCVCLWIAVMVQVVVTMAFEKEADITEAFALEDNVNIKKCSIEGTACLNADRQSFDKMAVLFLENVIRIFDEKAGDNLISSSGDAALPCYITDYNTDDMQLHATVSWTDKMNQAYFHCRIDVKSTADQMGKVYDKLDSVFDYAKVNGQITDKIIYTEVEAERAGHMSESECSQYAEIMFGRIGAKQVTDGGSGYYTVYGYTSDIYDNIQSNDNTINVQASFGYDEEKDVTGISLGSPVLNSDY